MNDSGGARGAGPLKGQEQGKGPAAVEPKVQWLA